MEKNANCALGGRMNLFQFKNKISQPVENDSDKVLNYMTQISFIPLESSVSCIHSFSGMLIICSLD